MIIDKIENSKIYKGISQRLSIAFEHLHKTDFASLQPGKYEIVSGEIYFLIQEYITKKHEECRLEGHKKYIDIQYIVTGEELMGHSIFTNQELIENIPEKDIAFYNGEISAVKLNKGMFAILFPDDLHMPCMMTEKQQTVKKVVFKVLM